MKHHTHEWEMHSNIHNFYRHCEKCNKWQSLPNCGCYDTWIDCAAPLSEYLWRVSDSLVAKRLESPKGW